MGNAMFKTFARLMVIYESLFSLPSSGSYNLPFLLNPRSHPLVANTEQYNSSIKERLGKYKDSPEVI